MLIAILTWVVGLNPKALAIAFENLGTIMQDSIAVGTQRTKMMSSLAIDVSR